MASRKQKAIDLDTKFLIIQEIDRNMKTKTEIVKNFEIPMSTLTTIYKKKDVITEAYHSNDFRSKCQKIRTAQHILMWEKPSTSGLKTSQYSTDWANVDGKS